LSEQPTELAFIALGSNIEPEYHLPEATRHLYSLGRIESVSVAYQSKPIGDREQPDFINAAVLLSVNEEPETLRTMLREIENSLGRERTEDKYASRTIDLDLVLFGDRVDPKFPLPDPDILTRAHLAVPLAELDAEFCHPTTHEALGTIANRLRSDMLGANEDVSRRLLVILSELGQADSPG
jgi:2-amino-4-hydroxy-6-hydroxymethyldihydropteridine diphosphokinase